MKYEQTTYGYGHVSMKHNGDIYNIPNKVAIDDESLKSLPPEVMKNLKIARKAGTGALKRSMREVK